MAADLPPDGVTFVALYNDGFGCNVFKRQGNDFYTAEGDIYSEENMDNYVVWIKCPDCFILWKDASAI